MRPLFLVVMMVVMAEAQDKVESSTSFRAGNELCPCLDLDEVAQLNPADLTTDTLEMLGPQTNITTYGIGCGRHDELTSECVNSAKECKSQENIIPQPVGCDKSFCGLSFCYVDPNNCQLTFRRSLSFPKSHRFYSYATCWDVDSFTSSRRISSVAGKVFKVGFNHNSGGWQGAYSSAKEQFQGPVSRWTGPIVEFAIQGAIQGLYQMNLTVPPEFLRNRSMEYFNSTSNFDFCVYATSLGYVDFCLAQYTITDQRAATTDWVVLGSQSLYLITQYEENTSGWERFVDSLATIFKPFTPGVWLFLVLFVIPALGTCMIVHELGHPGSAYPKQEDVIIIDNTKRGAQRVETRKVPMYRHVFRAVYISLLSVLMNQYEHSIVTRGAMINLLGVSFFILTIINVYTANLAAILTQQAQRTTIGGLDDALSANFRICSERKNLETIQALYPQIKDSFIVVDPVDMGGDGSPGFNCPDCAARIRVFDFLDASKAENDDRYCHAAFAPLEDLDVEQQNGRHCNKTYVGVQLGGNQYGFPVNEEQSLALISFFLKLKNDGVFDANILRGQPTPNCAAKSFAEDSEEALNISELSGIWIVSFGFAAAGLLVTWLQPKIDRRRKQVVKIVHEHDQHGNRINTLAKDDDWVDEQSIMKGNTRVYIGNSRWAKASAKIGGSSTAGSTAFNVMANQSGTYRRKLSREPPGDEEADSDDGSALGYITSEVVGHRDHFVEDTSTPSIPEE